VTLLANQFNGVNPWIEGDMERWVFTRRSRRMLYGLWHQDLEAAVTLEMGKTRREAWGEVDSSANLFRLACQSLSVLYDLPPILGGSVPRTVAEVQAAVKDGGLWEMMQRVQRDCIGLREMFVMPTRLASGELLFRPVPPDLVCAEANPNAPDEPVWLAEACLRDGVWGWDVYDVRDGIGAYYRADLEKRPLEGTRRQGSEYPYRWKDGTPYVPHVLYHSARTGQLWDAYELREIVEGTLRCGVLWTFFGHCLRNASWPQRYVLGAQPVGATPSADGKRHEIVTDPSTILALEPSGDGDVGGQPVIGQFSPGSQPTEIQEAVALYERRIAAFIGISPSDIQRVAGDARSGYALAINREGQRAAQRKFGPVFARADTAVLSRCAALLGLEPTTWSVRYQSLPPSPEELAEHRNQTDAELRWGVRSTVDVYLEKFPEQTREQAIAALRRIAEDNAAIKPAPTSPPPTPPVDPLHSEPAP
jgi:hypothetical protein